MKWVESKQQNSTSLPKAAFPAGRPPWAFPRQVPAGRPRWDLCRSNPGPPVRGSPVLRALWVGGSEAVLGAQRPVARPAPGGGAVRYCVPFGWSRLLRGLGAQRPVAPPTRRGSPCLPRNGEKEGRGSAPGPRVFMARLLPLARFGVCATLSRWRGYYGTHVRALIWRLSFIKCIFSIFFPENAFQIGLRIPEEIAPRTDPGQQPPKPASANERAINRGAGGIPPRLFASRLSLEKAWIPARDRAGIHLAGSNLRRS